MTAPTYPKIQTVWLRDPANRHRTLLDHDWVRPEFQLLAGLDWLWTEKIDGTNIRVEWTPPGTVRFAGRTDRASIPPFLLDHLQAVFTPSTLAPVFPEGPVCLYGEGFGARIQKHGSDYLPHGVAFILFDTLCGGFWLERENIEDVAVQLGIPFVPVIEQGSLECAIEHVRNGFPSCFGHADAEGLVLRPPVDLWNRHGQRVITKVKRKDFARPL